MEKSHSGLDTTQVNQLLEIVAHFWSMRYNLGREQKQFLRETTKTLLLIKIEILKGDLMNGHV